jgi:hypothetical protein
MSREAIVKRLILPSRAIKPDVNYHESNIDAIPTFGDCTELRQSALDTAEMSVQRFGAKMKIVESSLALRHPPYFR